MSHEHLCTLLVIVFAAHRIFANENTKFSQRIVVFETESVELPCPVFNTFAQSYVEWFYSGDSDQLDLSNDVVDGSSGSLLIEKVELNYKGKYTCVVRTDFGPREYVVELDVKECTKVGIYYSKNAAYEGETIEIGCLVTVDPSLTPKIQWLRNNKIINFESESRLTKRTDKELIIDDLRLSDSGTYTCVVSTEMNDITDKSTEIIVKGVSNAPIITHLKCYELEALVYFRSNGDNGEKILGYTIEYNSNDDPYIWKVANDSIPANLFQSEIRLFPWRVYRFRVIARNKVGLSLPSAPSINCKSEPDAPYYNPRGVKGIGTAKGNMMISWKPMPPSEHNGPGFHYIVLWRRFQDDKQIRQKEKWNEMNVTDWTRNNITINGLPMFAKYEISVKSVNDIAESYNDNTYIGYSAEGEPTKFPENFMLVNVTDFENAFLSWDPIPPESVNGNVSCYVIHIWNDIDGQQNKWEIAVGNDTYQTTIAKLRRTTQYYAQIFVKNHLFSGPKSDTLKFMTPLPDPSSVQSIEAYPLGSSAFLLKWTKPLQIDGILTGYNIYYEDVKGTIRNERLPRIKNPAVNQVKLDELKPNTTYRLYIVPISVSIDGHDYYIEATTNAIPENPIKPNKPSFSWEILSSEENNVTIKVNWIPDLTGNSGSHFFVKYHLQNGRGWKNTTHIHTEDYVIISGLLRATYDFEVVSVDGDQMTESEIQTVRLVQSSCPIANKFIIIIVTVVILSVVAAIGAIPYVLPFYRKIRSNTRRKKSIRASSEKNKYHNNPNEQNSIHNQYELSGNKSKIFEKEIELRDALTTAEEYSHRYSQTKKKDYALEYFLNGNIDNINPEMALDEQADMLPYDKKYEFPREKLKLGKQLGTGAFGVVLQATAYGIVPGEEQTIVAVKTVKEMADDEIFRTLALELKIMIYLGKHLNIVNLLGAITENIAERELMIIVEYCEFGNLQSFLVKHRQQFVDQISPEDGQIDPNITSRKVEATNGYSLHTTQAPSSARSVTTTDLLCWSFQIARGMHYLASCKVLHGDLAARNILLCEGNVVKICDFGLARSMYRTGNYYITTERPLPYKWLAIESIGDHVFSTYSDVWSYGIVLWELFSLGSVPYPGMIAGADLFKTLKDGYRMECPDFATQDIYEIMLSCWDATPESRPLFDELANKLSKMLGQHVSEHYVSLNNPYSTENETRLDSGQTEYSKLIRCPQSQSSETIPQNQSPQTIPQIQSLETTNTDLSTITNNLTINDTTYYTPNEIETILEFEALENSLQINQTEDC